MQVPKDMHFKECNNECCALHRGDNISHAILKQISGDNISHATLHANVVCSPTPAAILTTQK